MIICFMTCTSTGWFSTGSALPSSKEPWAVGSAFFAVRGGSSGRQPHSIIASARAIPMYGLPMALDLLRGGRRCRGEYLLCPPRQYECMHDGHDQQCHDG